MSDGELEQLLMRAARSEIEIALEGLRKMIELEPEHLTAGLGRAVEFFELRLRYVDRAPLLAPTPPRKG